MTLAELEAAIEWLGRNRLSEHLPALGADHRFRWRVRQTGEWRPPVGRAGSGVRKGRSRPLAMPRATPLRGPG
jgi:hypothetical protein